MTKSFDIPKELVWEAYLKVKANKGAAGVDGQSFAASHGEPKARASSPW